MPLVAIVIFICEDLRFRHPLVLSKQCNNETTQESSGSKAANRGSDLTRCSLSQQCTHTHTYIHREMGDLPAQKLNSALFGFSLLKERHLSFPAKQCSGFQIPSCSRNLSLPPVPLTGHTRLLRLSCLVHPVLVQHV